MITITSEGVESYPDIRVSDGTKTFLIKRENAPDPYWIPDFHALNDNEDIIFVIDKTDGDIYTLFENLYKDVIAGNIYPLEKNDTLNKSSAEIKRLKREKVKQRKNFQKLAQETGLIEDGIIYWHSEDCDPFESSAILTIKKGESQIEIIFSKNKKHKDFPLNWPTYAIRISESWSIYRDFFCLFVRLHRNLQALDRTRLNMAGSVAKTEEVILLEKKKPL